MHTLCNLVKKDKLFNICKRSFLIVTAFCIVALVLTLLGCSSQEPYTMQLKSSTLTKQELLTEGTLTVGVDSDNAPFSNQSFAGIDIDIASAIADELGLKVDFVEVGSSSESAFVLKKADIVMGVSKATKSDQAWKSKVYLESAPALFSSKSTTAVPTKDDQKKYISTMGSSSIDAIQAQFGVTNVKTVTNLSDAFSALSSGNVDFVGADAILGTYQALRDNVDGYIVALLAEPSGYCVEVASDNDKLQTAVNEAISKLIDNGTIDVIERRWLARNINIETLPLTAGASNQANENDLENAVYGEIAGTSIQN